MDYNFYFENEKEALCFIDRALEIAKEYECVTLSDLYDLNGIHSDYRCNKIGWSVRSISNKVYADFNSDLECYVVSFPQPVFNENKHNKGDSFVSTKSYVTKKESETSSKPLNITICMDLLEDPLEVVHEVFDMANKIKDRQVFITIS